MDLIIENLLGRQFQRTYFGFVHVAMIIGYYTGFSINKFLRFFQMAMLPVCCIVLSHIIADIIAYRSPDLRKMIFGVVIGGIIPLFFIPILEVCSKK